MDVKITDRDLLRRIGKKSSVIKSNETQAVKAIKEGKAIPQKDPSLPELSDEPKQRIAHKARDYGGRRVRGFPYVAWVHDTHSAVGGAELSNQEVIRVGREFGFEIYECYPDTFDKQKLIEADFLIINGFFTFSDEQYHFIMDLLFEYKRPFVKYEHDHREINGNLARPRVAQLLFGRSFLNVFISPFQVENHRKVLGDSVEPYYLLPPPIDINKFKIIKGVERDKNKFVNMTGKLWHSKGLSQVVNYIKAQRNYRLNFHIYTRKLPEVEKVFSDLKNVFVYEPVKNDTLPEIYNTAQYVLHLPQAWEAAGRTIAEGVLCGCKPIMNGNVGLSSFSSFHLEDEKFDYDKFREYIRIGPIRFWKSVEVAWNGFTPRAPVWQSFQAKVETMRVIGKANAKRRKIHEDNV